MADTTTSAEPQTLDDSKKMSVGEIEAILTNEGSGLTADEYDEVTEDEDLKEKRVNLGKAILGTCQQLWSEGHEELDLVAEKLGDGSRDGESWLGT